MKKLWRWAMRPLVWAVLANALVWWLGISILTIPPDFPPLAGVGPTIFFTTVGALGAAGVFAILRRVSSEPRRHFRIVAVVVLIVSFVPDLLLLSEGAREAVPGVTVSGVVLLMVMHVVAAGVIVWALTGGAAEGRPREG